MGTNFYLCDVKGGPDRDEHIGKRSAAGWYCWDCQITLCKAGNDGIHYSISDWHKACPICGQEAQEESLGEGAVGRELGFNTSKPQKKTGVQSCSSFNWDQEFEKVAAEAVKLEEGGVQESIFDEYHRGYTWDEFLEVLEECPVQYTDSIGMDFR